MRRNTIFSLLVMATACTGLRAQMVVDSLGNVGIGVENAQSVLSVGGGDSDFYTYLHPTSNYDYALGVHNSSKGVKIMNHTSANTNTYGLQVLASSGTSTQSYYGIYSQGGYTSGPNYGIFSTLMPGFSSSWFQAALYATVGGTEGGPLTTGKYAGYFGGNVAITGKLTAVSLYCNSINNNNATNSTQSFTQLLSGESITDKLQKVSVLAVHDPAVLALKGRTDETAVQMSATMQNMESINAESVEEPLGTRYCLAADELREVYPDLVYEDKDGNVSINYVEMVPLLVQSIKELRAEIDELKGSGARKVAANTRNASTGIDDAALDLLSMSQNDPNPFTVETTIALTIPEDVKTALIIVYDMSGKKVKQIEVLGRGDTSVNMTAEGLTSGMYLYSLIADGKVVSTKRMILN